MKKIPCGVWKIPHLIEKGLLKMRFTLLLLLLFGFSAAASSQKVSLDIRSTNLSTALKQLKNQTGVRILFDTELTEKIQCEELHVKGIELNKVLDQLLANTSLGYQEIDGVFVIRKVVPVVQSVKITGTVVDKTGVPLPGVSVLVKGTTTGVATDANGNFELSIPESNSLVLVFSFVGMKTKELAVTGTKSVKVVLEDDAQVMEEVVITGYGTYKKASFTGAASTVGTDKVRDIPTVSVQDRLAGAVSGIQITSQSGQPGAVESVRIRGMGSMNAGNEPLYVIDGVPMSVDNVSTFTYSQSGHSLLSTLNSNDIESMTVIKDAAAASLYGSRAANGVIVITTKQGSAGKTDFNFKADWGFSDMAVNYRLTLGGEERRELLYTGLKNYSVNQGETEENALAYAESKIDEYASKPWSGWTNWRDLLLRKGGHQNYELSAQGGNEKTRFFSSLSYTNQEGITEQSNYERITGRLNVNHKYNHFTFNGSVMFAVAHQQASAENASFSNPIMGIAMAESPSDFAYNQDGSLNLTTGFPVIGKPMGNPLNTIAYNANRSNITRTMNTLSGQYEFIKGLYLKEVLSYDFINTENRNWWDPRSNDGLKYAGDLKIYSVNNTKLVSQTQLGFNHTFAQKHNLDALVSYEIEDNNRRYTYAEGSNYPSYLLQEITNASTTSGDSNSEGSSMISYVGRLNYDYDHKYYLSGSFRRDGTSRLSKDGRWGNFWSVSASWRLTQENFMKPVLDILSDAKLRFSYGVNGTQPNDLYGYMGIYKYNHVYAGNPGAAEANIPYDNLKWEKNYALNIGVDLTFMERFSLTFEWYNRETRDLLMDKPISYTTGFSSLLQNIGSMRNRGFELELRSVNFNREDFYWNTTFNIAHNKNILLKLDGYQTEITDSYMIKKIGKPYYSYYGYEYAGVDPETGKESFYINKPGKERVTTINAAEAQKVLTGSVEPKVSGGLTNSMTWKFIDFNFTFTYAFGGRAYDKAFWLQSNGGSYNYSGAVPSYYKLDKMWQKPGDKAELPQFVYGNAYKISSRWLYKTDHVRLKNITLGLTLPKEWSKKAHLQKVRVYASGSNLLTFKKKDLYFDPEVPVNGGVTFETPNLKTVTFGIELGF